LILLIFARDKSLAYRANEFSRKLFSHTQTTRRGVRYTPDATGKKGGLPWVSRES
jgi:hypothetical protein